MAITPGREVVNCGATKHFLTLALKSFPQIFFLKKLALKKFLIISQKKYFYFSGN